MPLSPKSGDCPSSVIYRDNRILNWFMGDEPADVRWHIISSFFFKLLLLAKTLSVILTNLLCVHLINGGIRKHFGYLVREDDRTDWKPNQWVNRSFKAQQTEDWSFAVCLWFSLYDHADWWISTVFLKYIKITTELKWSTTQSRQSACWY